MNRIVVSLMAAVAVMSVVTASCTQAAPAPAPTKAAEPTKATAPAAAPTKAPEPTKAPAPPTAVPAKKVDFPDKGKAISLIVPYTAGGDTSIAAQVIGASMEKVMGNPVEVLHRPGGGAQVGLTELFQAKPDGYTLGFTVLPTVSLIYLDPERKAAFTRKNFTPVAYAYDLDNGIFVQAGSPYKSLKDLIEYHLNESRLGRPPEAVGWGFSR